MICKKKMDFIKLEKNLNYHFKNKDILIEALSHPSLKQHDASVKHYEKLEILGDSIIGFLVTEYIYKEVANINEGDIAKIKSYAVSKDNLSKIGTDLKLANYIIMTEGEEASGGRDNVNNIENALEALVAAIYLDSDMNITRKIVINLWQDSLINTDVANIDPKSTLQELLQSKGMDAPEYIIKNQKGSAHMPTFTIELRTMLGMTEASGKSKKEAEKLAARKLLKKLK